MKHPFRRAAVLVLALCLTVSGASAALTPKGGAVAEALTRLKHFVAEGYGVTLDGVADLNGDSLVNAKDVATLHRYMDGGYGIALPAGSIAAYDPSDPHADNEVNLLFIGNSYCYYWTDELYGMLTAAGYQNVTVCNLHAPGCTLAQHWTWLESGQSNYIFITVDKDGRREQKDMSLPQCLARKNWDGIELLLGNGPMYSGGEAAIRNNVDTYMPLLTDYLKKQAPKADYYWLANWARELEYADTLETKEQQQAIADAFTAVAKDVQEQYGFIYAPCAAAWQAVRDDPLITAMGRRLTTRISGNLPDYDDYTHDGDVGGGQYLNACIWFEIITRTSCLDSTYRPKYVISGRDYRLSEAKIKLLQNTAHQAVAEAQGADWAK